MEQHQLHFDTIKKLYKIKYVCCSRKLLLSKRIILCNCYIELAKFLVFNVLLLDIVKKIFFDNKIKYDKMIEKIKII